MKILLVINNFNYFGGLQLDLWKVANELLRRGHEVELLTAKWSGEKIPGIKIHLIKVATRTTHKANRYLGDKLKLIKQSHYFDCVVGFTRIEGIDIYFAGDSCFKYRMNNENHKFRKLIPRYKELLRIENSLYKNTNLRVLTLTPAAKREIQSVYALKDEQFTQLPPPVDIERLKNSNASKKQSTLELKKIIGIPIDKTVFLFVASSYKTKGLDRVFKALKELEKTQLENLVFVIVGDDSKISKYKKLSNKYGLDESVLFLGARKDMANIYRVSDILLHPARREQAGVVILEALLFGLVVITTENVGYSYIINETESGLVIPTPYRQHDFNVALRAILHPNIRSKLAAKAKMVDHSILSGMQISAADAIENFVRERNNSN